MSRSSLLHKLSKHTSLIAVMPLRRHSGKDLLSHASSCPVRNDLFSLKLSVFLCRLKGHQFSLAHNDHIFFTVAAKLREGRRCLRIPSFFSDDQLSVAEIQCFFGEILFQSHRSHNRDRIFPVIFFVKICLDLCPFQIDMNRCIYTDVSELLNSFIHAA